MEIAIVGVAMFLNFAFIYAKFNRGLIPEAIIDLGVFASIIFITSYGGQGAMYVGTIASALFSLYLIFNPPTGLVNAFKGF